MISKAESRDSLVQEADKPSEARDRLIQVATVLFAEKGLDGVSTREIAKAAQLNISLISYYFGGKEGLYKAVFREHMLKFQKSLSLDEEAVRSGVMNQKTLCQEIEKIISLLVDRHNDEDSHHFMNLFNREKMSGFCLIKDVHEEVVGPLAQKIVNLIKKAQELQIIKKEVNPQTFMILMMESIKGYLFASPCDLKFFKEALDPKKQAFDLKKMISEIFLKGILK